MSGWEILIVVAVLYAIVNWTFFMGLGAPSNRTPLKTLQFSFINDPNLNYAIKLSGPGARFSLRF